MKLENAKLIVAAAEVLGLEVKLYDNYSGRGMYGKTTTGLVGWQSHIIQAAAQAAYELGRAGEDGDSFLTDLALSWDSMGRDDVIAY